MRLALLALWLIFTAAIATAQPRFEDDDVLVANRDYRADLMPGMEVSIYGAGLGPVTACPGRQDPARPVDFKPALPEHWKSRKLFAFPLELCGVRVALGGVAAELLYVQDEQINFRVPQLIPLERSLPLVVQVGGVASPPLDVETGIEVMSASVEQVAYTDLPVWLTVRIPEYWLPEVHYPFDLKPQHMGCNQVEMRRNGVLLETTWQAAASSLVLKSNCGSLGLAGDTARSRIPLHLIYRMDQPGAYEVRVLKKTNRQHTGATIAATGWVSFAVYPGRPGMRQALLERMKQQVPGEADELLTDYLPNLLGIPDKESFEMLTPFVEHSSTYVRLYAAEGYRYWPGLEPPQVGGVF